MLGYYRRRVLCMKFDNVGNTRHATQLHDIHSPSLSLSMDSGAGDRLNINNMRGHQNRDRPESIHIWKVEKNTTKVEK